ncbi:hypothetical protein CIG19_12900 [Enterobacterales bacterium CwR94]|nr:hypothetical protein CIG19_12900 [Enterobacterales bacterium CwR94]
MKQRGIALITVLLMIVMMSLLAVAGQRQWISALRRAENIQQQQQAKWAVAGAEQWLLQHPAEVADGKPHTLRLEESTVRYRWQDRQTCFNLNALAMPARRDNDGVMWPTAAQRIFAQLLRQQGVTEPQIAHMLTAITARLNPAQVRKPSPALDDKTQLRDMPELADPLWSALANQLCVLPETRLQININALTREHLPLLRAMLADSLEPHTLNALLANRPAAGWRDVDAFMAMLPEALKTQASTLQSVVVTESQYRELSIWLVNDHTFVALRSQTVKEKTRLKVLYRQYGVSDAS